MISEIEEARVFKWLKRIYDEVTSFLELQFMFWQLSDEDQEEMLALAEKMIREREEGEKKES